MRLFVRTKDFSLTRYSIITLFDAFEYHVFEFVNIIEYGAFAHLEQMLHFP